LKLIDKVPVVEQYSREAGAERETDYIFSAVEHTKRISHASEALALGFHPGAPQRDLSQRNAEADERLLPLPSGSGNDENVCDELTVKRGLKRRASKRKLLVDGETKEVL
jgi:hypothetical protein